MCDTFSQLFLKTAKMSIKFQKAGKLMNYHVAFKQSCARSKKTKVNNNKKQYQNSGLNISVSMQMYQLPLHMNINKIAFKVKVAKDV
jgi:hypothetical protein